MKNNIRQPKIEELKYSSEIKNMPFLFLETRRAANLICEGKAGIDIIELSIKQNVFQLDKERRRKELVMKVLKRLGSIDKNLIDIIANGRECEAKLITFLAIIKTDRLFFEFMRDVFSDKYMCGQLEIEDKDFVTFFEVKSHESEIVAKWKSDNLEKIKGAYKKILCEAGLAVKSTTKFEITKPVCDNQLLEFVKSKDNYLFAKSMLLEV